MKKEEKQNKQQTTFIIDIIFSESQLGVFRKDRINYHSSWEVFPIVEPEI